MVVSNYRLLVQVTLSRLVCVGQATGYYVSQNLKRKQKFQLSWIKVSQSLRSMTALMKYVNTLYVDKWRYGEDSSHWVCYDACNMWHHLKFATVHPSKIPIATYYYCKKCS